METTRPLGLHGALELGSGDPIVSLVSGSVSFLWPELQKTSGTRSQLCHSLLSDLGQASCPLWASVFLPRKLKNEKI